MKHNRKFIAMIVINVFLLSNIAYLNAIMPTLKPNTTETDKEIDSKTETVTLNPLSSADKSKATWWDIAWLYRVNVNISASNANYTDKLISRFMNFTSLLGQNLGTFDNQSVRVIEYTIGGVIIDEIPSKFETNSSYRSSTNASGILFWVMNGTTPQNSKRVYFIYFDVLENGQKSTPIYSTGIKLTLNRANDYTLENDLIRISICEGLPLGGGSGYDHMYEVFNKNTGRDQQHSSYRWGFGALYNWNYGGLTTSNFNNITRLEIVYNNSIVLTVKAVMQITNLLYEAYYTINHLDNTVEVRHYVKALRTITTHGHWLLRSWMNPGIGNNRPTDPISAYGLGGFNFTTGQSSLGKEFTVNDLELNPTYFINWKTMTGTNPAIYNLLPHAWYAHWDSSKKEGVGTVWNPNNIYFSQFGYRTGINQEGQGISFDVSPPNLAIGQTFEIKIWGIIFNGVQGDYVKNRSKGIQYNPSQVMGTLEDTGKMLKYHISDIDGNPISGAQVQLFNSINTELFDGLTDADGNVTIRELYNDNFKINSYLVINSKNYTLDESNHEIDQGLYERQNFLSVIGNLTKVNFYVVDNDIQVDPADKALINANVTIWNITSSERLQSSYTNLDGRVEFFLPATTYNVSVRYSGVLRDINLNVSTGIAPKFKNFTLNSLEDIEISVVLGENKTRLSISDTQYLKSTEGWGHSESIEQYPYSINIFRGDAVNLSVYYENVKAYIYGLKESEDKTWLLKNSLNAIIESGDLSENNPINQPGNYSVVIDSRNLDYIVGSYVLSINITKMNCQSGIIQIIINILNQTSSLTLLSDISEPDVFWAKNISIYVNYKSTVNATGYNITGAVLSYSLVGNPAINGLLNETDPGIYHINLNTSIFNLGSYKMNIFAYLVNINPQGMQVDFSVIGLPTNIDWDIPTDIKVSDLLVKVAKGENVSFTIDYKDVNGYIPGSTVVVYFNNSEVYDVVDLGDGQYELEFNSSIYEPGFSDLRMYCSESHHETQIQIIQLQILDFWNTQIELKVPPSFYPWSNNASYRFKYFCNEYPRYGRLLSNGIIDQLNVTIENNGIYTTAVLFTLSSLDETWGYHILGNGLYEVWFNTSKLEIDANTVVYAEPSISQQFYRSTTFNPYIWIRTPRTSVTPFFGGYTSRPTESFEMFLNDKVWVNITYKVTDSESDLDGKMLRDATVTYSIYNSTNSLDVLITKTSIAQDIDAGFYLLNLKAIKIGIWKVNFTASLSNYTTTSFIVVVTIMERELVYDLGSGMDVYDSGSGIIATPQNIAFNMSIDISDKYNELPLADVNISFVWQGTTYEFEYNGNGKYSLLFSTTMLAAGIEDNPYNLQFSIQKTNYTEEEISISLAIGLQVDPYLRIPIRYWIIIAVTIGSMVGIFAVSKGVSYARVPLIVKQINKTMSAFQKSRKLSSEQIRPSRDETVATMLAERWEKMGLKYPSKSTEGTRNPQEELQPNTEGGN
jgi:hypothetical protein